MQGTRLKMAGAMLCAAVLPLSTALAQEPPLEPPPVPTPTPPALEKEPAGEAVAARQVYTPEDFARFSPRNALQMVERVPGFTLQREEEGRGLGQASGNLLINGERVSSKAVSAREALIRIPADRVERIELVDGATLDIPGLAGRIANVVVRGGGDLSGQFEWDAQISTGRTPLRWSQGNISVSGTRGTFDYTLALANHPSYRGGRGPAIITEAGGLVDERLSTQRFTFDAPTLSGRFAAGLPGDIKAELTLSYTREILRSRGREARVGEALPALIELLRTRFDEHRYEVGADVELPLGPGRLRLIGLEGYDTSDFVTTGRIERADRPDSGTRFTRARQRGERIGRGEYSWAMWGGDWQLSGEAAFNRLESRAALFTLDPVTDGFAPLPFPAGSGGVREDRYEAALAHSRPLTARLSVQASLGGEVSTISQTGADALSRRFLRPKGQVTLAWAPAAGTDVNLLVARRVGQLEFSDFLASVDLSDDVANAGNNRLRPQQSWEIELEVARTLGRWGSATLTLFDDAIEDFITIVPVAGGGESAGNIASARSRGVALDATINTDPLGLTGARVDVKFSAEDSRLADPVTGIGRRFDRSEPLNLQLNYRHDLPRSDVAYGFEFRHTEVSPYFRVAEEGLEYNFATFGAVFVEHKDVAGLTVRLRASNLFNAGGVLSRTVFAGSRDEGPVLFTEDRRRPAGQAFNLRVSGSF